MVVLIVVVVLLVLLVLLAVQVLRRLQQLRHGGVASSHDEKPVRTSGAIASS